MVPECSVVREDLDTRTKLRTPESFRK